MELLLQYSQSQEIRSWVISDEKTDKRIRDSLIAKNIAVIPYSIDNSGFKQFLERADPIYKQFNYYQGGTSANFLEKALEHYLAATLINLSKEDIYVDIANCNSPTPEIYHALYGCEVYRQDLIFPEGIHGNIIGGDAANLPLENQFASKMALHCSFEHFENDADIRFIVEAARVLKTGGKLCIVPLYMHSEYAIQTDPLFSLCRSCVHSHLKKMQLYTVQKVILIGMAVFMM